MVQTTKGVIPIKLFNLFSVLLATGLLLSACGGSEDNAENSGTTNNENTEETNENQESTENTETTGEGTEGEGESSELLPGVKDAKSAVEELTPAIEENSDTPEINQIGETIEKKWDKIEKQIEEQYPEDYENIEKSLYPLINESKAEEPDTEKLKQLAQETTKKLEAFIEKIGNS
ncbi:hypothetical protein [Thalassobacillus pellis]|uniref:hypothetical protein n=1 Tax=Thalassobacillus pellis TaxID=748008 RepID=UPI0019620BCD|nr:hypothetical protein [Thalassobacillus pellis]MBM7554223.1 iron uptake system EfeUOB component EfeO/EfeM [Thalassobacillus pellis]